MNNCPMCESTDLYFSCECPTRPFEREGTGIETITYLGCKNCGLAFQIEPVPENYYKNAYRTNLPAHCETVRDGNIRGELKRAMRVEYFLGEMNVSSCLDIGSSTGELLRYFQKILGCQVQGIEPSDAFREYANFQGTPTAERIEEIIDVFYLVTCVHVLEHIVNPMPFLAEIKKRVGKFLYLEVPFLSPKLPHFLLFTLDSLEKMVEAAGFTILQKEHNPGDNCLRVLCAPL